MLRHWASGGTRIRPTQKAIPSSQLGELRVGSSGPSQGSDHMAQGQGKCGEVRKHTGEEEARGGERHHSAAWADPQSICQVTLTRRPPPPVCPGVDERRLSTISCQPVGRPLCSPGMASTCRAFSSGKYSR